MQTLVPLLASSHLPHLQRLLLKSNAITDEGVAHLCASPPAPSLLHLDLSHNQIGDAGMASLAAALEGGRLAVLDALQVEENAASAAAEKEVNLMWERVNKPYHDKIQEKRARQGQRR